RPSLKNRQRWTFGGLVPQAYSEATGGSEPCATQTECLVAGDKSASLEVVVRFLHLTDRQVGELPAPVAELPEGEPAHRPVDCLEVNGTLYQTWQEAVERSVKLGACSVGELVDSIRAHEFEFPAGQSVEALRETDGRIVGVLVRQQQAL